MESLTCKSFRTIHRYGGVLSENDFYFSILVKCIMENCESTQTIHEFFSCLDTRRAWALTYINHDIEKHIYDVFQIPMNAPTPYKKKLRDILHSIRSNAPISRAKKELFLYSLSFSILRLIYHSMIV